MWPLLVANLTVSAIYIGLLLRAIRRYSVHMDAIENQLDRERDEIIASMRAETDRAIAEFQATAEMNGGGDVGVFPLRHMSGERTGLPTVDEVTTLPRWARVAFAARCARRVAEAFSEGIRRAHPGAVEITARAAEQAAAIAAGESVFDAGIHSRISEVVTSAQAEIHRTAVDVEKSKLDSGDVAILETARASAEAAAVTLFRGEDAGRSYTAVVSAGQVSWITATRRGPKEIAIAEHSLNPFHRQDFEVLLNLSIAGGWTDDTPVPPSVFGPLWPDGPPDGWPKPDQPITEVAFEFDIPDDISIPDAITFARLLAVELCHLHLAGGGHGLAIQPPLEITRPALVPVPTT